MIGKIKLENPHLWDEEMQSAARGMILEGWPGSKLRTRCHACGVLGMNANMMEEYLQFVANRDWRRLSHRTILCEEPVPVDV